MTRRSDWPEVAERAADGHRDSGGSVPSRAGTEPPRPPQEPVERARAICLRLLTSAPRTRSQLANALYKRDVPVEVAEKVLNHCEAAGLVDDAAFANAWVESRHHSRGLARPALSRELRNRGVDNALIEGAVEQVDSDQEESTARTLVERKLRSTRGLESSKRLRRLVAMLARKGYSEGLALRLVREMLAEEGSDTELVEHYLSDGGP